MLGQRHYTISSLFNLGRLERKGQETQIIKPMIIVTFPTKCPLPFNLALAPFSLITKIQMEITIANEKWQLG
jgi:hypothetical protein